MVRLIFGQNYCCVVRGQKIVVTPTLPAVKIHHPAEHVSPGSANSPDVHWELLVHVRDGHGLSMQRPPPHHQHVSHGVDKPAHVEHQQLMDRVRNFDLGNLHGRK